MAYPRSVWWLLGETPITEEQRESLCDWVRSLGLDPSRLGTRTAVVEFEGSYELHVDEAIVDSQGKFRFDPFDENSALVSRRILRVEEGTWPSEFGETP